MHTRLREIGQPLSPGAKAGLMLFLGKRPVDEGSIHDVRRYGCGFARLFVPPEGDLFEDAGHAIRFHKAHTGGIKTQAKGLLEFLGIPKEGHYKTPPGSSKQ